MNRFWYTPTIRIGAALTQGQRISNVVDLLSGAGFTWTVQPSWDTVGQQVISGQGLHYSGTIVPELELWVQSPSDNRLRAAVAVSIDQWLDEVGIKTTVVFTDFYTILDRVVGQQDFDLTVLGWSLSKAGPPPTGLDMFFHSRHDAALGGFNYAGYSSPAYDALCDAFMSEMDREQARQHVYGLQQILADDLPYLSLYSPPVPEAYRSDTMAFPYTTTIGGLQELYGMPAVARLVPVQGSVDISGGTLVGHGGTVDFPAGAFTDTVTITYTVQPPPSSTLSAGIYFDITPVYSDTGEPAQLVAGMTFTIVVGYDENGLAPGVSESSLKLYYWDDASSGWLAEPTSVVDIVNNTITATPDHFSLWTAFGERKIKIYLPIVLRE